MKKLLIGLGLLVFIGCGQAPVDETTTDTTTTTACDASNCMCLNPFSSQPQMLLSCTVINIMYQPPIINCVDKSGNKYTAEAVPVTTEQPADEEQPVEE